MLARMSGEHETRFWHPFADMGAVRGKELVIERGEDVWVWDAEGRRYLDATASLWYCNVGHGRPEIAAAVAAQLSKLEAYSAFGDFANAPANELTARLAERAPMRDARVFLGSGGGDGIETAAKLARRYWQETGSPDRNRLLVRTNAYHGTHGYGTALAGIPANRAGWGPLPEDVSIVPHDSLDVLRQEVGRIGADRIAAVFVEPVIGAGGVHPPPPGYIEGVAELCEQTGILLVCDAVICGFGRLGTWFGIERWPDVVPDLIVFAKGVTSGYLPLGGVVASGRIAEPFWAEPGAPVFRHGATYAAHPTCCAAALANLELLGRDGLLERGRDLEDDLLAAMTRLTEHPLVTGVRGGCGTLAAIEVTAPPAQVVMAARKGGVLVRPLGSAVAVSPPLTAGPEHFDLVVEALAAALDELAAARV
jgi:adenosylmethionine-8-amino-7-oxononanoate aminotransferase